MNQYEEQLRTMAHNSFVQCYVELGFVGGTFFFALFYLPLCSRRPAVLMTRWPSNLS